MALATCAAFGFGIPVSPAADEPGVRAERLALRTTPIVKVFQEASPAVVNLSTTKVVTVESPFGMGSILDEIFDFPSPRRAMRYKAHSVGSGFLIHGDGYLVTNAHVVDRAAEIRVTFADRMELEAEEVAIDRRHDLAVLKVRGRGALPHLKLARSDDLMPGETVIAIGNPLGYQHTVTTGIISALDRELAFDSQHVYTGLIQIDASINPGNSGGPLLNVLGELIGINTAIRGDAQNIGFAIPVNRLHELLPEMLDIERLRRVDFGIHFDGRVRDGGPVGAVVKRVEPDTPAAKAGVKSGDILVALDNQPTPGFMDAFRLLERTPPGQSMKLDLVGEGGERRSVEVELAEIPKLDSPKLMNKLFGLGIREMTREDLRRMGLERRIGLVVTSVAPESEALDERVAVGDVITQFGGWPVNSLDQAAHLLEQVEHGDSIPFRLLRIGNEAFIRYDLVLRAR